MNKILSWLTGDVFKSIGSIVDDVVTTKEEKEQLKNELYRSLLAHSLDSDKISASIIETEANGSKLQRAWRPVVMLSFALIVFFHYFLYPVLRSFNPELPELPQLGADFWTLLQVGIGGYVITRSAEKIIPQLKITK